MIIITGAGRELLRRAGFEAVFYRDGFATGARARRECARNRASGATRSCAKMPQPVIAKINGWVFGGGFTVRHRLRYRNRGGRRAIRSLEVNFGHFPGGEVTIVLTEHLQPKHGLYYALTGKTMNAKEAERIGLITKAVPRADLDKEVMDIANNLKEKAPSALNAVKEAWYYTFYSNPDVAYEISGLISDKAKAAIGGRPGLQQFARKEYRPGLGSYKVEEKK